MSIQSSAPTIKLIPLMIIRSIHFKRSWSSIPPERVSFCLFTKFKLERTQYAETNILVQPYGNPDKLTIDLSVRIPRTQKVRYTPGILETLKYAWI